MTALDAICARYEVTSLNGPFPIELYGGRRDQLPALFAELGYTHGAEIGVWQGAYSELLCQGNPALHLFCVDPWVTYPGYQDFTQPTEMARFYEEATARLAPYGCTLIREFSPKAAEQVADRSLDFVYIDGHHGFEHVVADLAAWTKKVKVGGIIAGHDYKHYRRHRGFRVIEAVNGYTAAYDIAPWFVLGRRTARKSERSEVERSYLWVNQP